MKVWKTLLKPPLQFATFSWKLPPHHAAAIRFWKDLIKKNAILAQPKVLYEEYALLLEKESGLKFSQIRPSFNEERGIGDSLFLTVPAPRIPPITVANIYNAPTGATNPGAGLATLLSFSDDSFSPSFILAGDMNLHHKLWQPSLTGPYFPNGEAFIYWLDSKHIHLISELETPTHNRGNVLDICFASDQLIARGTSATVQSDLDATSDHLPLLITVPSVDQGTPSIPRFSFATVDDKIFNSILQTYLAELGPIDKSQAGLDKRAEQLSQALYRAYAGSAKAKLPHNKGQPW
ncbi:hypothetical protein K3495_g4335 [Podosphaera aphanis]|nr:hypothetical protein K3495_g4335 [Podosphaera aphanis]